MLLAFFLLEYRPVNVHPEELCPGYFLLMPSLRLTFEALPYFGETKKNDCKALVVVFLCQPACELVFFSTIQDKNACLLQVRSMDKPELLREVIFDVVVIPVIVPLMCVFLLLSFVPV